MSRTTRAMHCTPQQVFDVLSDGWSYATWVVGASRIRDVDQDWPAVGSHIHHSVGSWPMLIDDNTVVEEMASPSLLQLRVRAWPTGEGRVRITCLPAEGGCEVVMEEYAVSGPAQLIPRPVQDAILRVRNVEALKRLAFLAEGRARNGERPAS